MLQQQGAYCFTLMPLLLLLLLLLPLPHSDQAASESPSLHPQASVKATFEASLPAGGDAGTLPPELNSVSVGDRDNHVYAGTRSR